MKKLKYYLWGSVLVLLLVLCAWFIKNANKNPKTALSGGKANNSSSHFEATSKPKETVTDSFLLSDCILQDFLTISPYARCGQKIGPVNSVVVHYVGNPGTTAAQNRNYFEGLKDTQTTKASSHFIVGLDGEIIQCVPLDEISYASNNRNSDTISIECCHPDETGRFTQATYDSLIRLTAALCNTYGLTPREGGVIRHYDVTHKECPKYFVDHEDEWKVFLTNVTDSMNN